MTHGITYEAVGSGGEAIIFLHGIGADAGSFHHQMNAFDRYRTIAWNMPGYRGSELRQNPPDFAHLSDRLAALIAEIGGPVHLVGQSIGGMVALDHALRRPQDVSSLSLVATTPRFGGRDESFKTAFLAARLAPLDAGQTMEEMAAKTAPHLVGPDTSPKEIARIEARLAAVPEATWRGILHCLVTFDRYADLSAVTCPTLVVGGALDQNAPAKTVEKMAAQIPDARCLILSNAGHMLHQERPDAFNAEMTTFLNEFARND